jgi:hypothetical protein
LPLADPSGGDARLHGRVFEQVQTEVEAHRFLLSMLAPPQGPRHARQHFPQTCYRRSASGAHRRFSGAAANPVEAQIQEGWIKHPWTFEKLPRLTERSQTSRCSRSRSLAGQSWRMVRTAGLSKPKKKRLR